MEDHIKHHLRRYGIFDIVLDMSRDEDRHPIRISIEIVGTIDVCRNLYMNGLVKIGLIPGAAVLEMGSFKIRQTKVMPVKMVTERDRSKITLTGMCGGI